MVQRDDRPGLAPRRRGRPVNSDSAETRSRILRASRQVINERGYQAATFQAIAVAADLSRPTLRYYFASREEIHLALVAEARAVVGAVAARARRHDTLAEQFSALVQAIHETARRDRSLVAFLVSAQLASRRNSALRALGGFSIQDLLTTLVAEARARDEITEDVATGPVVELLNGMFWGVSFHAGFDEGGVDMSSIGAQLTSLLTRGLQTTEANAPTPYDTDGDTPSVVGGRQ